MRNPKGGSWGGIDSIQPQVAVSIDKDKGSQAALKWTLENLVNRGQTLLLIHVKHKNFNQPNNESYAKEIFLPFRCFCTRKDVICKDVILEEADIAKGVIEYTTQNAIEKLVLGAASRSGFARFKTSDVPTAISKGAPDFCTVYIISKGKVSSCRNATRPAPTVARFRPQMALGEDEDAIDNTIEPSSPIISQHSNLMIPSHAKSERSMIPSFQEEQYLISSLGKKSIQNPQMMKTYGELSSTDESFSDFSFVTSSRHNVDKMFPSLFDEMDGPRSSGFSNTMADSLDLMSSPQSTGGDFLFTQENNRVSGASRPSITMDNNEAEMKRLRLELKQTMEMYNAACKEAVTAQQKTNELNHWKKENTWMEDDDAQTPVGKEKSKSKTTMEGEENVEKNFHVMRSCSKTRSFSRPDCIKYTIEEIEIATENFKPDRKIGEGGYGPVYKCYLNNTAVAIKTLRPDANQGQSQFRQEVEVLSRIHHPNMVLLLGTCPEYGCLVYEYLSNGSLEDRLLRRGDTPVLPWQLRFKIADEICTSLLFLHQMKPEPIVHRDLKPANILLDHNYVSKISDVGLARLVPPNVANDITQYRMTSAAGTFCYIDPEYQQTGMLGIKSDIYSLGIMLLQIITARPPMGLTHSMENSIENGTFKEMLDPAVKDWPVEEALSYAKMALQCAELRRKDRPDLGKMVLPEMNRLRALADENMHPGILGGDNCCVDVVDAEYSPQYSAVSMSSDGMTDSFIQFE